MLTIGNAGHRNRPNILILCVDQWQRHMKLPDAEILPALRRLELQRVSFDRHYCTVPICTPSRATMWTGAHAKTTGLWDNTNFAWINDLSPDFPTMGQRMREQGYYTAFKGKWHCSEPPNGENSLEPYGFADYQQWGDMYGAPLQGEQVDGAAAFEVMDWLEHKPPKIRQPWLLVASFINPHDIMFLQSDPIELPHPKGAVRGLQTQVQRLGWFQKQWDIGMPENYEDDYALQPYGVRHFKEMTDLNYGNIPDDRTDLWLTRRNYLINCMRLVDQEISGILDTMDRLDMWKDTVVLFTTDHGEMNGAHRMTQKGAIAFDEAAVVNLTACVPGGPKNRGSEAVGSHLDLVPTMLNFAGLSEDDIRERYPDLTGRSLLPAILDPDQDGSRGSAKEPGDGALFCWDGLHSLDKDWAISGALRELTSFATSGPHGQDPGRAELMREAGRKYGAPDFSKRTFYRAIVDGRYKLVRWFSPEEYGNPTTLEDLYATSDVALYDLERDPGELENIGHPEHRRYDKALVALMLDKLNVLALREIGDDQVPFDLDLFGTRELKYQSNT